MAVLGIRFGLQWAGCCQADQNLSAFALLERLLARADFAVLAVYTKDLYGHNLTATTPTAVKPRL